MFIRATNGMVFNADRIDAFEPSANKGKWNAYSERLDELCEYIGGEYRHGFVFDESEVKKLLKS